MECRLPSKKIEISDPNREIIASIPSLRLRAFA
jgi:hypothetical protein